MRTDFHPERLSLDAEKVQKMAYAPYSNFMVGAALLDDQGEVHCGCNVENGSFGLTVCAERNAVGMALSRGRRQFVALAIASPGGVAPCGACRQVLAEFAPDLAIVLFDSESSQVMKCVSLDALLPMRFDFSSED